MTKLYPITVSINIAVTDGSQRGEAIYDLSPERSPTDEDIEKALSEAQDVLPDGFRVMTRHEHFMHRVLEKFGRSPRLATPDMSDGEEWHDPNTANTFCDWGVGESDED